MILGEKLKNLRSVKGITLKEFEAHTGISQSYLNRLETGSRTNPSIDILRLIANYYNISILELLGEDFNIRVEDILTDKESINLLSKFLNHMINRKLVKL